jgi:hypothetical protein
VSKTEKDLKIILEHMATRILGYIASAVVDLETGLSVSQICADPEIDCDAISVYLASIVNSHIRSSKAIPGIRDISDISLTTDKNYFVIRILPEQQVFIYVMTEMKGRLESKRSIMEKYGNVIIKTLKKSEIT